jgi:CspA family cold shock protein
MIGNGRVSWFSLDRKFGFVSLDGTAVDAFLHLSVLKSAGYVAVPAGTSMQVSVETDRGHLRVVEVSNVDTSTALAGEPAPVTRKRRS